MDLKEIKSEEYLASFGDRSKMERAFMQAWEIRTFEIDLYWKRATYFWTLQVPTFAGYFAVLNSSNYIANPPKSPEVLYLVVCIGFIISFAWVLVDKGSKAWQRNWEGHIELLEDGFTGPLYKSVLITRTYSVSKINEIVSWFFVISWFFLAVKYWQDQGLRLVWDKSDKIDWFVALVTLVIGLFVSAMLFGYGRGFFGNKTVTFYRKGVRYKE